MKHAFLILSFLIVQLSTAQSKTIKTSPVQEDMKVKIEIDSYESLQDFDMNDLDGLFEFSSSDSPIELEIICKFEKEIEGVSISNTSFKVSGNSNDLDSFYEKAEKVKTAIKNLYQSKR